MAIQPQRAPGEHPAFIFNHAPRNVYWEMTQACDLACAHCRADACPSRDAAELSTEEGKALIREVKELGSMLILTGGDPLKRDDLFELMQYARDLHVPLAITPSTTPGLTRDHVAHFAQLGVAAMGVSLDGPDAARHDGFRNVEGTFECSMNALDWARELKVPVQVNTTVTSKTVEWLPEMYELLAQRFAPPVRRWSLFLLIPVGRGLQLGTPNAARVEELFEWVYQTASGAPFHVGTVEAPHYRRFWLQQKAREGTPQERIDTLAPRMGFGIRDGNGVVFVSHRGEIYPAGFLPEPLLGNVRTDALSQVYRQAPALHVLRDSEQLQGRCGACEYRWACGGSRARAFAMGGDAMGDDPLCAHQPQAPVANA